MKESYQASERKTQGNSRLWFKFFAFLAVFCFIIAGYFIFKETYKKYQMRKEAEALSQRALELEQGVQKLEGLNEYYRSMSFSEKEGKEKLNVKKEGEKIVILQPEIGEDLNEIVEENKIEVGDKELEPVPNPIKWWNYFFKNREK